MNYAVIRIKGHQYRIEEGQEFLVDKINTKKPEFDVLLVTNKDKVKVGNPTVKGSSVKLKILENEVKGKKLHVTKFKAKSRYRKKIGFKPVYSKLLVEKVG